MKGKFSANILC